MSIHLNNYHLNMTLCRILPHHSIHSYRHNGKVVIKHCSISSGIFEYIPKHAVISHQYWQDMFHVPCLWHSLKGSSLGLPDQVRGWVRRCTQNKKGVCLQTLYWGLAWEYMLCEQCPILLEPEQIKLMRQELISQKFFPAWFCTGLQSKLLYAPPHSQRNRDQ
jgi:hypothetical protein